MSFDEKQAAADVAKILLDTKSVLFNAEEPFTFTSGRRSPVYIDCRRLISFVKARRTIMAHAKALLDARGVTARTDIVAGGETAGIAYAAWLAEAMDAPMLYVRKQPKGFGRMAQIEGVMDEDGETVLLVEDLATDGGSKVKFCEVLREAGAGVTDVFAVFCYGIFPQVDDIMAKAGVTLHYLATWWDVLDAARAGDYFDAATLDEVEAFLKDPDGWEKTLSANG